MSLKSLSLTNFRNHKKSEFQFGKTTIIIGKNTAGKTNILEAVNYLSLAKSFKADQEIDVIHLQESFAKIEGKVEDTDDHVKLSILFNNQKRISPKKYLVNNVARRAADFASHFIAVLFTPEDIDIVSGSPGTRRRYIDSILYKSHKAYRVVSHIYEKALKHRNRMLHDMREGKKRYPQNEFDYWDNLLIEHGSTITQMREHFVAFVNENPKKIFQFDIKYDKSLVNEERFEKYYEAERASGVTLIGPQRDDFFFYYPSASSGQAFSGEIVREGRAIKEYGSRGEQRLTLLQLKLFEIEYLKQNTEKNPTLLLDDIFSELDDKNIEKVFKLIPWQQTIITTTHEEFVPDAFKGGEISLIPLE